MFQLSGDPHIWTKIWSLKKKMSQPLNTFNTFLSRYFFFCQILYPLWHCFVFLFHHFWPANLQWGGISPTSLLSSVFCNSYVSSLVLLFSWFFSKHVLTPRNCSLAVSFDLFTQWRGWKINDTDKICLWFNRKCSQFFISMFLHASTQTHQV